MEDSRKRGRLRVQIMPRWLSRPTAKERLFGERICTSARKSLFQNLGTFESCCLGFPGCMEYRDTAGRLSVGRKALKEKPALFTCFPGISRIQGSGREILFCKNGLCSRLVGKTGRDRERRLFSLSKLYAFSTADGVRGPVKRSSTLPSQSCFSPRKSNDPYAARAITMVPSSRIAPAIFAVAGSRFRLLSM